MKDFLMWIVVIIGTLALLFWIIGEANEKEAGRLYARAHVIEANSAARQDLLAGLMPYVVVSVSIIGGTVAVIALTVFGVAIMRRPVSPRQPERIIETYHTRHTVERTRTILILQPGQHSRREVYKLLGGDGD